MTRKQWINQLTQNDCVSLAPLLNEFYVTLFKNNSGYDNTEGFRSRIRHVLKKNKISQRHINIQRGRLATGLSILPLNKLLCS